MGAWRETLETFAVVLYFFFLLGIPNCQRLVSLFYKGDVSFDNVCHIDKDVAYMGMLSLAFISKRIKTDLTLSILLHVLFR